MDLDQHPSSSGKDDSGVSTVDDVERERTEERRSLKTDGGFQIEADSNSTRSQVVLSFWLVLLLSLPIWWNTTKIERRSLPMAEVSFWNSSKPCPIRFPINISTNSPSISVEKIDGEIQRLKSRSESRSAGVNYLGKIDILTVRCLNFNIRHIDDPGLKDDSVIIHRSRFDRIDWRSENGSNPDLTIVLQSKNKPKELLRRIAPLTGSASSSQTKDSRVIKYASHLKLIFSLMNEDITQPGFLRSWNIKHAIEDYLVEDLARLAPLHNFTCQTQVLYHSPLAIEHKSISSPTDQNENVHVVEEEDLKAFINDAEWKLASPVTMDPVLHFILWVPSPRHRPFKIRRSDGTFDRYGSFIRPQWGSVVIFNPDDESSSELSVNQLSRPIRIFKHHLLNLIGLNDEPTETEEDRGLGFDGLIRRRILENSLESINSLRVIVDLINDQKSMRVSGEVQSQVKESLRSLELAQETLSRGGGSLFESIRLTDRALKSSSTAFFSPTMLSMLYFPDEHKYAIYTPLFGPILFPLMLAGVNELRFLRRRYSDRRGKL
ncbi:phosphatidylinositol-glycan biosynthesis class S protein-domain-containing protein [Phakopsora pachyrhizi]|uniref:Phosphatidylinositol-glycan biosynthesis class S protein-domain-containing protein n=1 Tax=Phakopsora pachyrhizi TaxID=170000 RepID=A0AAV0AUZ2_PHAPC|nr:phosphatidylinositol-glycan biosynthesis class S protein-domain-containing protein [Phakopsora pachyrhizi]CAH7671916.1 phosphatidylinositol-glycan biosynthesis class S protein-domain-containing protein [Phakopsora pachyrhizi]